jgi:hypothetical protein
MPDEVMARSLLARGLLETAAAPETLPLFV